MNFPSFEQLSSYCNVYDYSNLVFVVSKVLLLFVAFFVSKALIAHFKKRISKTDTFYGKIVSEALDPIHFLLVAIFSIAVLVAIFGDLTTLVGVSANHIINLASLLSATWFMNRFSYCLEKKFVQDPGNKIDPTAIQTLSKLFRLAIFSLLVLSLLPYFGFDLTGILTLGAASSLVLGLASKDLLSNFFGGLMIFIDKPFGVGDWIKCTEKNLEGRVITVGWRLTCILSPERRPLYIPNSFFAMAVVENSTRMENRRIKHFLNFPYRDIDKIPTIISQIKKYLLTSPDIDSINKHCFVHLTQLASTHVECMIYCFTKATEWEKFLDIQQKVILEILKIIKENDSSVALPTSEIRIQHIDD